MSDPSQEFQKSSLRLPLTLFGAVFAIVFVARVFDASRNPFSYPKGPAAVFYEWTLVGGGIWVLACSLLLLFGTVQSWLLKRRERFTLEYEPLDLWDYEIDGRAPLGG